MKPLEVDDLAVKEAVEARRWYAGQNPSAATGFDDELRQAFVDIVERPQSFPRHREGTRRALMDSYPYLVVFRELYDRIVIVAIAHGKRKPGYWRKRLK